jgi:hypothetical protein
MVPGVLTGPLVARQRWTWLVALVRVRTVPLAPLVSLACERHHVRCSGGVDDSVLAGGGQIVRRAG